MKKEDRELLNDLRIIQMNWNNSEASSEETIQALLEAFIERLEYDLGQES